jgi:hypothetical protein
VINSILKLFSLAWLKTGLNPKKQYREVLISV